VIASNGKAAEEFPRQTVPWTDAGDNRALISVIVVWPKLSIANVVASSGTAIRIT